MLDGRTDEYYVEPFVGGCNILYIVKEIPTLKYNKYLKGV